MADRRVLGVAPGFDRPYHCLARVYSCAGLYTVITENLAHSGDRVVCKLDQRLMRRSTRFLGLLLPR